MLGIVFLEDAQAVPPKDREHAVLEAQDHQNEESDAAEGVYLPKDAPEGATGTRPALSVISISGVSTGCHFHHPVGIIVLVQLRVLSLLLLLR